MICLTKYVVMTIHNSPNFIFVHFNVLSPFLGIVFPFSGVRLFWGREFLMRSVYEFSCRDLSYNKLTGEIPSSFVGLSNADYM